MFARSTVLALSVLALGTSCRGKDPDFALAPFASCDALEASIKDQAITEIRWRYSWGGSGWGGSGWGGFSNELAMAEDASMGSAAPRASNDGAGSYSETNLQESDVDEADLVKTDGTHLFSVAGNTLVITQAWPDTVDGDLDWDSVEEKSRVSLEGTVDGLYLLDDGTLIVLSQLGWEDGEPLAGDVVENTQYQWSARGLVKVTMIDASDVEAPVVMRETYTPGQLFTSRMVSGRLYTVTYTPLGIAGLESAEDKNESIKLVKASKLDEWLPKRFDHLRADRNSADWSQVQEPVCDCESVLGSERESGDWLVSVQTLDTSDLSSAFQGSSVLTQVDTVYASADTLYVASSESTDTDSPWQSFDRTLDTYIHSFDITEGPANPGYKASGKVPGWVLNQFAMDESDDRLRVATTSQGSDWNDSDSGVYVLEQSGSVMEIVGQVTGLGTGEQIFAVRFVDDAAFVVTYLQVDPLYTIDLSDPVNPVMRGELKIPGFSNYLHMVDADHVLGIGQDMDENGWESFGVQISLFDISDLDDPKRAQEHRLTLDDTTWSSAQNEHHAFNYFGAAEALVVPAYAASWGQSRMHVIHVNPEDALSEVGAVSQEEVLEEPSEDDWNYEYCTEFSRSVIMGDPDNDVPYFVYAQSNAGITVAELDDPSNVVASVAFTGIDPCPDGGYYYW
jgi:uncharacterized secreted protein with C-terminal beta-propeller domain